jgi:hypothetical protein
MSILNAITAGAGGVALSGDTTGNLVIQSAGSNVVTFTSTGMVSNTGAPSFYASSNTSQTVSNVTWTKIQFNLTTWNLNSNYDTSNYRFTPTVAGYYQVNLILQDGTGGNTTTNYQIASIYKNGSNFQQQLINMQGSGNSNMVSSLVYLNGSTDYIEAYWFVSRGGSTAVDQTNSRFNAALVRSA